MEKCQFLTRAAVHIVLGIYTNKANTQLALAQAITHRFIGACDTSAHY